MQGSVRHLGTSPEEVKVALEGAVKGAFEVRVGKQRVGKGRKRKAINTWRPVE